MKFILLALLLGFVPGCAHKPCRNCEYGSRLVAHFDKKQCKDQDAGKFECKKVVFDPQALDAKAGK
jgi:hypothetical protein